MQHQAATEGAEVPVLLLPQLHAAQVEVCRQAAGSYDGTASIVLGVARGGEGEAEPLHLTGKATCGSLHCGAACQCWAP